jgi:chromosome segregation ATPase
MGPTTQTQETCSFHTQINSSQTIIMASFTKSQESIHTHQQRISKLLGAMAECQDALALVEENILECDLRGELKRKSELEKEETSYTKHYDRLKSRLTREQDMLSVVASSASTTSGPQLQVLSNTPQKGKTLPLIVSGPM